MGNYFTPCCTSSHAAPHATPNNKMMTAPRDSLPPSPPPSGSYSRNPLSCFSCKKLRGRNSSRYPIGPHGTFASGDHGAQQGQEQQASALFYTYARKSPSSTEQPEVMSVEGVIHFLEDLNLAPDDFRVLLFAWQCSADVQCQFTRAEFIRGCLSLQAFHAASLREQLNRSVSLVMGEEAQFVQLYKWAFHYCLEEHQRCVKKEHALAMWRILFMSNDTPHFLLSQDGNANSVTRMLAAWLHFLQENAAVKVISQDTWDMLLKFLVVIGRDAVQYDETDAWPTLMDEFMEFRSAESAKKLESAISSGGLGRGGGGVASTTSAATAATSPGNGLQDDNVGATSQEAFSSAADSPNPENNNTVHCAPVAQTNSKKAASSL